MLSDSRIHPKHRSNKRHSGFLKTADVPVVHGVQTCVWSGQCTWRGYYKLQMEILSSLKKNVQTGQSGTTVIGTLCVCIIIVMLVFLRLKLNTNTD